MRRVPYFGWPRISAREGHPFRGVAWSRQRPLGQIVRAFHNVLLGWFNYAEALTEAQWGPWRDHQATCTSCPRLWGPPLCPTGATLFFSTAVGRRWWMERAA